MRAGCQRSRDKGRCRVRVMTGACLAALARTRGLCSGRRAGAADGAGAGDGGERPELGRRGGAGQHADVQRRRPARLPRAAEGRGRRAASPAGGARAPAARTSAVFSPWGATAPCARPASSRVCDSGPQRLRLLAWPGEEGLVPSPARSALVGLLPAARSLHTCESAGWAPWQCTCLWAARLSVNLHLLPLV
jgi:hypothetical protein